METNFYLDDLEQLLKEATDNFRMYPSRKVWHSLYNDLHPGRRWPSLAVWLLFISSIIFIGVTNKELTAGNNYVYAPVSPVVQAGDQFNRKFSENNRPVLREANPMIKKRQEIIHHFDQEPAFTENLQNPFNNTKPLIDREFDKVVAYYKKDAAVNSPKYEDASSFSRAVSPANHSTLFKQANVNVDNNAENELTIDKNKRGVKNKTGNQLSVSDKEWIEDFAFHNQPLGLKWKSKINYQFYFTPSIGYRTISKNTSFNPVVNTSLVAGRNVTREFKDAVKQVPAVNIELGGNLQYSLSKKFNIKLGVQFNYTNYNIHATELKHPTMTSLVLNDLNTGMAVLSSRSSTLANSSAVNSKQLNNNSYQISLPIGADMKLAGNGNLKWYAGATIQPTFIARGNNYLISADLQYYVTDNSLLRKWNLNAGIETFVSYKTRSGIILNAGPQFRYQFLSSYSRQYTYDEKLYNLGLKIGIITRL